MPRLPCPRCGDPIESRAWEMPPRGERGRPVIQHGARTCYPLDLDEEHAIRCACGREVRFRLLVLLGVIRGGVGDSIACECGVRWRALNLQRCGMSLYVA